MGVGALGLEKGEEGRTKIDPEGKGDDVQESEALGPDRGLGLGSPKAMGVGWQGRVGGGGGWVGAGAAGR